MSDWQVGDLALCLADHGDWVGMSYGAVVKGPENGAVSRVIEIGYAGDGLKFAEFGHFFHRDRFRKIRPDEHEACEPEFVTLLKRVKAPAIEARRATTENTGVVEDESAAPKAGARK
jgi:hypothetical protein